MVTAVLICVAGTFVGFVASIYAAIGYGLQYRYHEGGDADPVLTIWALWLGTGSSLAASIAWTVVMLRSAHERDRGSVKYGLIAGIGATCVLHGGLIFDLLMHAPSRLDVNVLWNVLWFVGIGLACGLVAGFILGGIGGQLVAWCVAAVEQDAAAACSDRERS